MRKALPTDRPRAVSTVAAAFAEDPAWAFLLGEEYDRVVHLFAGTIFDLRVRRGEVWVTDDVSSVAMWDAPAARGEPSPDAEGLWANYRSAVGDVVSERLATYNGAVAAASPAVPYWYLGVLATDPACQRRGGATAVLAPVLAEADSRRTACCLETSTEANRRFYEQRGFSEATEVLVPSGPPTWWLRRDPKAA